MTQDSNSRMELRSRCSPEEREAALQEIETLVNTRGYVAGRECVAGLIAEIRSLASALDEAKAAIRTLSTPNIAGRGDDIGYEEDDFESLAEIPNEPRKVDWANRVIEGDWYAVLLVTKWDGDEIDEEEVRLYPSRALADAAVADSIASCPSASEASAVPEGSSPAPRTTP